MLRRLVSSCVLLLPLLAGTSFAQAPSVSWVNERLTVRATNAPLADLVTEVATRAGLIVVGTDRLAGRRSLDFADLSVGEALPKLLADVNYLVTRHNGVFQIRIHSMSGSGRGLSVEQGPLHVSGLTDRRVGGDQDPSDALDFEDVDDDQQEELAALEDIGQSLAPESLPDVLEAMQSDFFVVRIRALQLLSRYKDARALNAIVDAMSDEDYDVSLAASDVLGEIPGETVVKVLFQQLGAKVDAEKQFGALRALALRADLATIPLMQKAMPSIQPQLQELAAEVLRKLEARAKALAKAKQDS